MLYVNCNDKCCQYYANNNQAVCQEVYALYSAHEEAESHMFFYLKSIDPPSNVIIRTADTDCLIITLACGLNYDYQIKVWMEVGTHTSNNIRYINIDEFHSHVGKSLCKSLPAYHAFTGSNYTALFTRRGKVKPFKTLEKSTEYQSAFIELKEDSEIKETTLQKIEEFVCVMYRKTKSTTVNDARLDMFLNKYKTNEDQRINAATMLLRR